MALFARKIVLSGAVQGCGLRPALVRLAANQGWHGSVRNTHHGVELILQGQLPDDENLRVLLINSLPSAAVVEQIALHPCHDRIEAGFRIAESHHAGVLSAYIPRDRAICRECLRDVQDPGNRRFQYAFTTCAECGPRFSILFGMPFDRERTAMRAFEMCDDCRRDYEDPSDRRFHAQTISCPQCGPRLWITDGRQSIPESARTPWKIAADALTDGRIVALKGIGGYQLLADATSSSAVQRLRQLKRRTAKPFAVLCENLAAAQQLGVVDTVSAEQLQSLANPIVLVPYRLQTQLAADVNPGLADIGLLLPTTALHHLIVSTIGRPLVCTSGNQDGEPLAYQNEAAEHNLSGIADLFLHHDRDIVHPVDDSVVRIQANNLVTFRAGRGIAPLALRIPTSDAALSARSACFACGAQQKSAFAWHSEGQSLLSPHVGDLETSASRERWEARRRNLLQLTALNSAGNDDFELICDPHPGYATTQWATTCSKSPQFVWHHHAHVVAGMLEHGWLDREVLGVAWDGTGLGPDGTIWGGEFLRATATNFSRVAHLRPFHLPGGAAAVRDLRRTAFAVLTQLTELSRDELSDLLKLNHNELNRWDVLLKPAYSPLTTSCGRLFDAAACLILARATSEFEGQAAMYLEAACDDSASGVYELPIEQACPAPIDWRPAFREIVSDCRTGVPRGVMAMKFHRGMARLIVNIIQRYPDLPVVLGGGVFQNRVLVELIAENWPAEGPPLGLPGVLPPHDGGLAAGQLAVALMSTVSQEKADVPRSSRPTSRLDQSRSAPGGG